MKGKYDRIINETKGGTKNAKYCDGCKEFSGNFPEFNTPKNIQ